MKILVARIILLIICSIIVGYFLSNLVGSIPIIYWSVSKDECVKIVVYDTNRKDWVETSCNNMPNKYEKIYVE